MAGFRLSAAAQADIITILARTYEQFGELARLRYELLLVTAFRDVASAPRRNGCTERLELGDGIFSYHLRHSRERHLPSDYGNP